MTATHIVIALNGVYQHEEDLLSLAREADGLVAADGGANWLVAHDLTPSLLVGDLDSVRPLLVADLRERGVTIEQHSPRKDETDAELALLRAVEMGAMRITLIGALGGRIDHTLGNIGLLALPSLEERDVAIYDGASWLRLIRGEIVLRGQPGDTVSLIPWGGNAEGIVTEGLEYPLRGETLYLGPARGVSNVMTTSIARVTCCGGALLVIHTPQAQRRLS